MSEERLWVELKQPTLGIRLRHRRHPLTIVRGASKEERRIRAIGGVEVLRELHERRAMPSLVRERDACLDNRAAVMRLSRAGARRREQPLHMRREQAVQPRRQVGVADERAVAPRQIVSSFDAVLQQHFRHG